jgi:hypothetical protein
MWKNADNKLVMTLASHENCFGHLRVFLEKCQGIADLSVWHRTPNMEGLFKQSKTLWPTHTRRLGMPRYKIYKHPPKGDSLGQLNSSPCFHKLIFLCIHDTRHWSIYKVQTLHNCETIRHCVMWVGNVTASLVPTDMVCVDLPGLHPNAKWKNQFPRYKYPLPVTAWSQEWRIGQIKVDAKPGEGMVFYIL